MSAGEGRYAEPVTHVDPVQPRAAQHQVSTTTTFKTTKNAGSAALVIDALTASEAFEHVSVEQGRLEQGRVFTAHGSMTETTNVPGCVLESAAQVVAVLRGVGLEAEIIQVYGRLVTYGKQS